MQYFSVEEARDMDGVRLVLSTGAPGPFGEVVKAIFRLKGIEYVPVAQYIGEPNVELVEWTGIRNAPVVVVDGEKPLERMLDIVMFAERLKPEPAMLPKDSAQRALTVGICNEIFGEEGMGWARRALSLSVLPDKSDGTERLRSTYRATEEAAAKAPTRIADVLNMLSTRLHAQREAGSPYLIGDCLTVADIYWACASISINPPAADVIDMPDYLRAFYSTLTPEIEAVMDPILFEHRDRIFEKYMQVPFDF